MLEEADGRCREAAEAFVSAPASMRVTGGLSMLIARLAAQLGILDIQHDTVVKALARADGGVAVTADTPRGVRHWQARAVVVAVPPRLVATWDFTPPLAAGVRERLAAIPTWMAGHAKAIALYPEPFWRTRGLSGQAFSQRGPLGEIHDASPADGSHGALMGFFLWPRPWRVQQAARLTEAVSRQLARLFGQQAARPVQLHVRDWADDPLTATAADATAPQTHPVYGPVALTDAAWGRHLVLAATEVAPTQGGYLEGALEAADHAVAALRESRP